jgi:hypothetical protein
MPMSGGVEIARVDFWNSSTKAYYGHATITSNAANPTTAVDIYCEFGNDVVTTTNKTINYTAGATSTFKSGFPSDTSSAIIKLPTETEGGSIKITINCTAFKLEDVSINIGEFVRNPLAPSDYYPFIADGKTAWVSITAPIGRGAVFRNGMWYADTDGDHQTDIWYQYGGTVTGTFLRRTTQAQASSDHSGMAAFQAIYLFSVIMTIMELLTQ